MVSSVSNKNSMLEQPATTCNNLQQPSKIKKIYKKIEKL